VGVGGGGGSVLVVRNQEHRHAFWCALCIAAATEASHCELLSVKVSVRTRTGACARVSECGGQMMVRGGTIQWLR